MPASAAARATFTSGAPAPARMRWPGSTAMSENPLPRRITTPAMPPSRTTGSSRVRPRAPESSAVETARKHARSSSSAGVNSTCAGPPVRNQDSGAVGAFASSLPRSSGIRGFQSRVMSGNIKPPSRRQRFELSRERIGPLGDVAGAEADHVITRFGDALDEAGEILGLFERDRVAMATGLQARRQDSSRSGTGDRLFACRIDRRDDHRIGIVEACAELIEQRRQARIAVRLHHGDHLSARSRRAPLSSTAAISIGWWP